MIQKRVQCPVCHTPLSVSGESGQVVQLTCSACGNAGKVTFPTQSTPKSTTAIEVTHLRKVYGDIVAVDDISFSVNAGEVFAFLGPNGAGKTTTVEMIEAIRTPTAGTISILGRDINTSFHEMKERIGILPQEFHSFERLTVRETLQYFSMLFKHRANIDNIISAMDLKADEKKLYKNLSGGLKQRVGVAIALVNDPEIIFLDEPTTGLDPKARREVWEVIAGLKQQGKTVFLTTHYMEEAEYLADHIAIIHKGKIIAEGTLEELIKAHGSENILLINNCKTDDAAEVLQSHGFEVAQHHNGDLEVKISYNDQVLEVLSHLRHECIEYDNISIRRSNLEEIFLKLTGAKLTEAGA